MKRLSLLFACFPLFLQSQVLQPNISQSSDTVTSSGRQSDIVNKTQQAIAWRLTWWYTGFSAVTGQIDCAPDNGSGGAGTYAACGGAFDGTTNPQAISATPQAGTIAIKTPSPHVAVNFTSVTGTGTIHYLIVGYVGTNVSPSTVTTSGGGGGGTLTPVQALCTATATVTLSGTGFNTIVAASGSTKITVCNLVYTSASAGTPTVNTFTLAHGASCGGSPTTWLVTAGVTGYTDEFLGTLISSAGDALCAKEGTANSDVVTVTYLQQ